MKFPAVLLLPLAVVAACAAPKQVADFAANDNLCGELAFVSKLPGDRSVFVTPVVDERAPAVLPTGQDGYPILYDADGRWQRSPTEMMDELLRRELAASRIFAKEAASAKEADVVLVPSLVTFATGAMELDSGARALADVAVRVKAFGPVGQDGQRALLLDQVYADRATTEAALAPPSRFPLAGQVVRSSMLRMLQALDGSNVGRDGVPVLAQGGAAAGGDAAAGTAAAPAR